jgi:hypothetical protein
VRFAKLIPFLAELGSACDVGHGGFQWGRSAEHFGGRAQARQDTVPATGSRHTVGSFSTNSQHGDRRRQPPPAHTLRILLRRRIALQQTLARATVRCDRA